MVRGAFSVKDEKRVVCDFCSVFLVGVRRVAWPRSETG